MKRTTQAERKANAIKFYDSLKSSGKAVVVVERTESTNPNLVPCKFISAASSIFKDDPIVIAENKALGREGCFYELFENIKPIFPQKGCFEEGFTDWVYENYGIKITYDDGYSMIFEY